MKEHRIYSFLFSEDGSMLELAGPTRESDVARHVSVGYQHFLTKEFPADTTDREVAQFAKGLKEGRDVALERVRTALGFPY